MAIQELGPGDDGRTVVVHVGDEVTIRLDENPTTGYRWVVEPVENLAVDVRAAYVPGAGGGIGGGGERIVTLAPRALGTAKVRLALRRSWEPATTVSKSFEVSLVVE